MTDDQMDARLRLAGERWRKDPVDGAAVTPAAGAAPNDIVPHSSPHHPRRRTATILTAAALIAGLALGLTIVLRASGGPSDKAADMAATLTGNVWQLDSYDGHEQPAGATIYVDSQSHFVGDDECGVFGATVTGLGDKDLRANSFDVRHKSCTDRTGIDLVTTTVGMLKAGATWQVDDGHLTISAGAHRTTFTSMVGAVPPTLDIPTIDGAEWIPTRGVDATGKVRSISSAFNLRIGHEVLANLGCDDVTGSAAVVGDTLRFRTTSSDTCGRLVGQHFDFLGLLQGTVEWSVRGTTMTLSKAGVGTVTFRWEPNDPSATTASELFGKMWTLRYAAGHRIPGNLRLYLGGQGGSWSAQDGCRWIGGTVRAASGSVTLTREPNGAPTCGGKEQALTIDNLLTGATLFAVRGNGLILYSGGSQADGLIYQSRDPGAPTSEPGLVGPTWTLSMIEQRRRPTDKIAQLIPAGGYALTFGRSSVTIDVACGTEAASTQVDGNRLTFTRLHTVTDHSCPYIRGSAAIAAIVDRVLGGSVTWTISDVRLRLTKDGTTLSFTQARPSSESSSSPDTPPVRPLVGTTWALSELANPADADPSLRATTTHPTLVINTDGAFSSTGGCPPSIAGTAHVDGATIAFARPDKAPCDLIAHAPSSTVVAAVVGDVLDGTVRWSVAGGRLTLIKSDTVLVFDAR